MLTVTTSWDDGDILDEKLGALLERYGVKGTFYISKDYRADRLPEERIRALSRYHEIGAHTLTHPDLRTLARGDKETEITGSKKWLEDVLAREVPMFCYPSGHFDAEAKELAQAAGYRGARTTEFGILEPTTDPFLMPTTLAVYPMPFRKLDAHRYYWGKLFQPFTERARILRHMGVPLSSFRSFESLSRSTFDIGLKRGGIFHLWGHSWEIERYGMWDELERVLRYISRRSHCKYVMNGELV